MILILLGTQDKPFERILKAVSKSIKSGNIKDKVIAQVGCTKYDLDDITCFDFKPKEEVQELIKEADMVITHGGVGTIIECISNDKKVIVVPRLKKYKEHTNDHQLQITKEFADKKYIIPLYDVKNLNKALDEVKTFMPLKYESNQENFVNSIRNYIDKL